MKPKLMINRLVCHTDPDRKLTKNELKINCWAYEVWSSL